VEFYGTGSSFGGSPADEADKLATARRESGSTTQFRPAADESGTWTFDVSRSARDSTPSGSLALLAYDPITKKGYVVDISEPINTSGWQEEGRRN